MAAMNGYAALVKQRTIDKDAWLEGEKRRPLDDYETPEDVTERLLEHVPLRGRVLEPACGSGRIVRVLRKFGCDVTGTDVKTGDDFLNRSNRFPGHIATNPPYRDGLAEAFTRQALELAIGRVCMLLEGKFLWGEKRAMGLFAEYPPDKIIIIPDRIYFFQGPDGDPLGSQFFNHAWICWPDRETRTRGGYAASTIWAPDVGF